MPGLPPSASIQIPESSAIEKLLVFAGTALMQTGKAIEIVGITMLTYLTISLSIAALMNWYNKRIEIKEK